MTQSEKKSSKSSDGQNKWECFKALHDQEGGKLLVAQLNADVTRCVERIAGQYKTLTHTDFISLAAEIATKQQLARELTSASEKLDALNQGDALQ